MRNMQAATRISDEEIDAFLQKALAATADDALLAEELTALTLETGKSRCSCDGTS